jgi:deoxyxylulose-5-phosphate synthase
VKNIGIPDEFVEQGTQAILRSKYGLDARGITRQVLELFSEHSFDWTEVSGKTKAA